MISEDNDFMFVDMYNIIGVFVCKSTISDLPRVVVGKLNCVIYILKLATRLRGSIHL